MPVTITSRFSPLTYEEFTRPLIEQTQAQEALENAYIEASEKAADLMARANQQTDVRSYKRLQEYANSVQQQADALMRNGLSAGSRHSLLNMRKNFAQNIVPIQNAIARRDALAEEQRQLRLKNPDVLFDREASAISLDDLVGNPQMDYGTPVYGNELYKKAAEITAALGKTVTDVWDGKQIDPYYKEFLIKEGFSNEEIQAAIRGDGSPLNIALQKLKETSGISNLGNNKAAQQSAWNYITSGAMAGAGSVQAKIIEDAYARRQDALADRAHEEDFQKELWGIKNGIAPSETYNGVSAHFIGYNNTEDGRKVSIYEDSNGQRYTKDETLIGGKRKAKFVKTDLDVTAKPHQHTQAEQQKTVQWYTSNGGYVSQLGEEGDGYRALKKKLSNPMYLYSDGTFDGGVKIGSYDEMLPTLTPKEQHKLSEEFSSIGLDPDELMVIKINTNDLHANPVFIVSKDYWPTYLKEIQDLRKANKTISGPVTDPSIGLSDDKNEGDDDKKKRPGVNFSYYMHHVNTSSL